MKTNLSIRTDRVEQTEGQVDISVVLSPEKLAALFWDMGHDEQARFFNELAKLAGHVLDMQLAHVVEPGTPLNMYGANAMTTIGDYGKEY